MNFLKLNIKKLSKVLKNTYNHLDIPEREPIFYRMKNEITRQSQAKKINEYIKWTVWGQNTILFIVWKNESFYAVSHYRVKKKKSKIWYEDERPLQSSQPPVNKVIQALSCEK